MSRKRTCEACKRTMGEGDIRKVDPRTGKLSCTQCLNSPAVQPNKIDVTASVKADGSIVARSLNVDHTAWKRVTAHDGGDGKIVRHCFSCGSGGVVGRSDGTVECTICETVFTVQVQPRNTFAPQTVNGNPVHIPGMPEESEVTPSTEVPGTESAEEQASGETGNEVVPTISDDDLGEFMTATGQRLDAEAYAQYLALGVSPERDRTLAMVRQANRQVHST